MAHEEGGVDRNDDQRDPPHDQFASGDLPPEGPDLAPTVTCSTCDREWDLSYELDDLHAGNRAIEQFALDHYRHTGHYPDDVSPWRVSCEDCPAEEQYLEERPARRFGETHARHTRHSLVLHGPGEGSQSIAPGGNGSDGGRNATESQDSSER